MAAMKLEKSYAASSTTRRCWREPPDGSVVDKLSRRTFHRQLQRRGGDHAELSLWSDAADLDDSFVRVFAGVLSAA
jgi:hypothetical protein